MTRRKQMKLLVSLLLILAVYATQSGWLKQPAQKAQQVQPGLYALKQFVDGDTIVVDMNGHSETIRMIGVDTPETHKPNSPVECYGRDAAGYTAQLIGTNNVRLQADPLDTNRDRYGRLLRYVYLSDGTLVESKLISEGYGFAYTQFPFEQKQQFIDLQDQAQAAGKGLWSACQISTDSSGRHHTQPVQ